MADNKYLTPYEKRKAEAAKKKRQQAAAVRDAEATKRAAQAARDRANASSASNRGRGPNASPTVSGFGQGAMAGVSAGRNMSRSQSAQTARLSGSAAAYPKKPAGPTTVRPGATVTPMSNAGSASATAPSGATRSGKASSSGRGSGAVKAQKPKASKPVLQQNTMWVKAADSKTGKGYLAQRGKPEKRVTARVKIQADTESGKKAGSTYAYKSGKTVKKVGKK